MSNNTNANGQKTTKRVVRSLNDAEIGFVSAVLKKTPLLSDADISHQLKDAGYASDLSLKDLRNKVRYARLKITGEAPAVRTRVQTHKDGSVTVNRCETGMSDENAEKFLDEKLLEEMNLDPRKFVLSSYGESEWETANGDTLHSTRKKFVRMNPNEINADNMATATIRRKLMDVYGNNVENLNADIKKFGDAETLLANVFGAFYGQTKIVRNENAKYSLILPNPDDHIGEGAASKMVKSYKATYQNYIIPHIKERYFSGNSVMVDTIDIPILGDMVHCDNGAGTTTAGTALHPKSDVYTSFDHCVDFFEWLICTLRETFKVPVRLIYVYGNHDTNMGFGIIRTLQMAFRKVNGVEFIVNEKLFGVDGNDEDNWYAEAEKNPEYLWVPYGDLGITYTHGKFMKKNMKEIPEVANIAARKMVSYNVVMYGHLHHINEASGNANQHNYGLSTPNFVRDKFGRSLGCVTDPEFYVFEVNHQTNRVNYTQFPSLPYNKQKMI